MLMATAYPERNVVALGRKNYRYILLSWTMNILAHLSLVFYMENFHISFPLLLGEGTFPTLKKRHVLEGQCPSHTC